MNKHLRIAIALLLLALLAGIWFGPVSFPSPTNHEASAESRKSARIGVSDPLDKRIHKNSRIDAEWTPPVEFSAIGIPSPRMDVQRGQCARRHFSDPVTVELDEKLASRAPAVLAMTPADGRLHLNEDEIDLHTLVARRMVLNTVALDNVVSGKTSRILAPTTGDEVLTLEIQKVKTRSAETRTLIGRIAGEPEFSDVQLVYHDGVIHGTVTRYDRRQHFEYRTLADGHLMVRELDPSTMLAPCGNNSSTETYEPDCSHQGDCKHKSAEAALKTAVGDGVQIIPSPDSTTPSVEATTVGYTTFDIVIGYDQGARIADGGYSQIEARIIGQVDLMNTAFANSLITNTEIMLLGTIEDPYYVFGSTASGQEDELTALNNSSDGVLDTVTDYSTQLGADFVSFVMREADVSAGVANRPGWASIVARDYMNTYAITFPHEVGHNLGCKHSWGDGNVDHQTYDSNYGWRFQTTGGTKVRTIMSYDSEWARIPYFSNPNVTYGGVATGAVDGFDVRTQPLADQRYLQGGYNGPDKSLYGFNGANATLGAYNAEVILNGVGRADFGAAYAAARAIRASATIISPVASVNWSTGSTQLIYFIGGDHTDSANIDLYKGGSFHSSIVTNRSPATGRKFSWTLPTNIVTGSDYKIRVTLNHTSGGTTIIDSGVFAITNMAPNTVAVLSPNGNQSLSIGAAVPITWVSALGSNVKIELLKNGTSVKVLAANEVDDGHFLWSVSGNIDPASDYKIRISSVNNANYSDVSDANFSIIAPSNLITLPYTESFETGFGKWDPNDTLDSRYKWLRLSGDTPSTDTGPTAAQNGSWYIYTEASSAEYRVFEITTWVDLRTFATSELSFYYHMFDGEGGRMGRLDCELSTNGTNWTNLFTRSGNQGTSWLPATVDLSAYSGQLVKLRFKGTIGSAYSSDMCVDNITITGKTAFVAWSDSGTGIDADDNGDGIDNGMAWVLGATNKNVSAIDKLPTSTTEPEYLVFTYRRSDAAKNDRNTSIVAEYSETLGGWTVASHDGTNIIITETNDIETGVDQVQVKIKKNHSTSGKLFSRLKVVIAQ